MGRPQGVAQCPGGWWQLVGWGACVSWVCKGIEREGRQHQGQVGKERGAQTGAGAVRASLSELTGWMEEQIL